MGKAFPTNKDNIIDDIDDTYLGESLSEEEYNRLRRLSESNLLLITILMARTRRIAIEKCEIAYQKSECE